MKTKKLATTIITVLIIIMSVVSSSAVTLDEGKTLLHEHQAYLDAVSISSTTPKIHAKLYKGDYQEEVEYFEEEAIELPQFTALEDIVQYVYDSLEYDYTFTVSSAYEGLRTGKGVCQSYANLFTMLCEQAGIKNVKLRGYTDSQFHVINIIEGGIVYDTTWGDTDERWCGMSLEDYCAKANFVPSIDWKTAWDMKYPES